MDRLGTYRGYDIAVTLHSDGERKSPKWHASVQISLIGTVAWEPIFVTAPSTITVSEARDLAILTAGGIINDRPNAMKISDTDLLQD